MIFTAAISTAQIILLVEKKYFGPEMHAHPRSQYLDGNQDNYLYQTKFTHIYIFLRQTFFFVQLTLVDTDQK